MSPDRSRRILDLLPAGAIVVAEAGWLTTWYGAIELATVGPPLMLGMWPFALAVGAGLAAVRWRGFPRGALGDAVLLLLAVAAVVFAWLGNPAARTALSVGDWSALPAVAAGSWLLALAVWRGARHRDRGEEIRVTSNLLGWGIPLLAVPWVVGARLEPAAGAIFVGLALPATLLFVAAGLLAIGIARLEALGRDSGVDWRTNRSWLALLGVLLVGLAVVGLPAGLILGAPIAAVLATALGPLQVVLDAFVSLLGLILVPLLGWLTQLPPRILEGEPVLIGPAAGTPVPESTGSFPFWILAPVLVAVGALVIALVVAIIRRPRSGGGRSADATPVSEERTIVLPSASLHLPARPRWRVARGRQPATASDAYLALLADLEKVPGFARRPSETPQAHARRLRAGSLSGIGLQLLAADYGLERYAGAHLTERETRRAIARWRAIRTMRPGDRGPATTARSGDN